MAPGLAGRVGGPVDHVLGEVADLGADLVGFGAEAGFTPAVEGFIRDAEIFSGLLLAPEGIVGRFLCGKSSDRAHWALAMIAEGGMSHESSGEIRESSGKQSDEEQCRHPPPGETGNLPRGKDLNGPVTVCDALEDKNGDKHHGFGLVFHSAMPLAFPFAKLMVS